MAKLKDYDPVAPELILGMVENLQARRHQFEDVSRYGLRRIFGDLMKSRSKRAQLQDDNNAIAGDWISIGNDMRRAIRAYMTNRGLDADGLGLNMAECEGLKDKPTPNRNVRLSNTP